MTKKVFKIFFIKIKKPFDILINNSAYTTEMAAKKINKDFFQQKFLIRQKKSI